MSCGKSGPILVTDGEYEVTGDLTPDATGTYEDAGEHYGERYYQRTPNGYFLWWNGLDTWYISTELDIPGAAWWQRIDPNIEGIYAPGGTAVGDATVAEI